MDNTKATYLPEELEHVCSYCQVVLEPRPTLPVRAVSHGICAECKVRVMFEWKSSRAVPAAPRSASLPSASLSASQKSER